MEDAPAPPQFNPLSLSVEELARLLSVSGGAAITSAQVQEDLNDGAPVNPNGRINLVHFTAWLLREVQSA